MKAIRIHGSGDVRLDDVPTPKPAPDEVLIRVEMTFPGSILPSHPV